MAKKVKEVHEISSIAPDTDLLSGDIFEAINKKFKDVPNSMGFLSAANMITEWVSTGSSTLDLAISNRPKSGIGFPSFLEIYGGSASGKSLLAAHILAETQKKGGLSCLFDTENAIGIPDFYESIGLDMDKMFYSDKLRALEDIFESIEIIIEKSAKDYWDKPITIVIDSIMGATTKVELEADYDKDGWATSKALILSKAMRKLTSMLVGRKILIVFINQVRTNLGQNYGDTDITSGGKAIGFHSSVRLKTKKVGKISIKTEYGDVEVGSKVQVTVVKNRWGPPGRTVTFNILYDSGIDDIGSWFNTINDLGLLKNSGAWYSYEYPNPDTGELIVKKFQSKDFKKMLEENPMIKNAIYDKICDAMIMKYKINEDFGVDDLISDDVKTNEEFEC